MRIDLTATARGLLLNCADVGRVRIAKHIRQADGGSAAGRRRRLSKAKSTKCSRSKNGSSPVTYCFPEGGYQLSANGKQRLNQYVPKLQGLQNANYFSPAPPLILPACEAGKGEGYRWRTMLWQRALATTAGGTTGAQRPQVPP